jgi:hypothetical protein
MDELILNALQVRTSMVETALLAFHKLMGVSNL